MTAFCDCFGLKWLFVPSSVEKIAESAFKRCNDLVVICEAGTAAERFCKETHLKYCIAKQ